LCLAFQPLGCKDGCTANSGIPIAISGEVFLKGADETRTKVSCGQSVAVEFCKVLDAGAPADDRPDQGEAFLTISYSNNVKETVEVSNRGLVRCGRKIVQVDEQQMIKVLERMMKESAIPARP
jgi:hypothetical protein